MAGLQYLPRTPGEQRRKNSVEINKKFMKAKENILTVFTKAT